MSPLEALAWYGAILALLVAILAGWGAWLLRDRDR